MTSLAVVSVAVLVGCGGGGGGDSVAPPAAKLQEVAAKVTTCGATDRPETGLQGQVPAATRQAGFDGFSCNLGLVGQYEGEGGNWSSATYRDSRGRTCAYHSTGFTTSFAGTPVDRVHPGVPVIDITDPARPIRTTSLTTPAMLDPWESLRANNSRGLLVANNGNNGGLFGFGGPEIDVYDLSADCGNPQLLASAPVGTGTDGGVVTAKKPIGHEGSFAPDGLTYYVGDTAAGAYHAIDLTNPTRPKLIATFDMKKLPVGGPHGLSISEDGNRAYVVSVGIPTPEEVANPNAALKNGFLILDTSEVQARKPNAAMKLVSTVTFKDGSTAQHTVAATIKGKPYVVMVDEGGTASYDSAVAKLACNVGLAPFPMARIYDISDEKKPVLVSKVGLETHDPANCDKVLPDIAGLTGFTYGSHYCSVDNRSNATALACGYFNSGVRVFDIRNPATPKEIAYYNPAGVKVKRNGSAHAFKAGAPDLCASRLDFDAERKLLTTMCQDNGLLVMKFANGTWPFADSTPSTLQN